MKKRVILALILSVLLIIAGCGASTGDSEKKNHKSERTATAALVHVVKQTKKISNMEMKTNMMIVLAEGDQKSTQQMETDSKLYLKQPFLYQTTKLNNETGSGKNSTNMEQYADNDAMYLKSGDNGKWISVPFDSDAGRTLKDSIWNQTDPSTQLDLLRNSEKNLKISEKGSNYRIQFHGDKKSMETLIKKAMLSSLSEAKKQALNRSLDLLSFTSMSYAYEVDQKTYQPKSLDIAFTAKPKSTASGSMKMTIHSQFSKINQLEKMTIPAEVKEKAMKIDAERLQGQF
ncbi:hypothetical protein NIE88_18115 [Sporolactobacillus shoreicorticis]|uniref:DUF6612 family protein n=1 Tax=Sporolactobacillus shoreicorticis TaxID=1923877 RepID=A0ABW5S3E1_9BACL|nr:DUF6612 family protein [Sporolactobacillus shoreicorticis]MCO7127663.1 hypothetical protein [Sporolactobacillus shoreicorticis]